MARNNIDLSSESLQVDMSKLKDFQPFSAPSRYGMGKILDFFKEKKVTYAHYDHKGNEDTQITVKKPSFWDRIRGKKPEFISISGTSEAVDQCLGSLGIKKETLTDKSMAMQQSHDIPKDMAKYTFRISSIVSFVREKQKEAQTPQFREDLRVKQIQNALDKKTRSL